MPKLPLGNVLAQDETTTTTSSTTSSTTTSTTAPTTTTTAPPPAHFNAIVTGALAGGGPHVKAFKASDHTAQKSFYAYDPNFNGGVNVALGDVDGDGYQDIVTGAGPGGGPHVKVFSGQTGAVLASFFADTSGFSGGVNVAACDVNNDGKADIITGLGAGGAPRVRVWSGAGIGTAPALLSEFNAYSSAFAGGVRVAAADLDGDGKADIITGAGPGGGPHVQAFKLNDPGPNAAAPTVIASFFAYNTAFAGGVFVGASVDGGHVAHIVTGAGPGGGQHARIFDSLGQPVSGAEIIPAGTGTQGAAVAIGALDDDTADEYVIGNASASSTVRVLDLPASQIGNTFDAYPGFPNGVSVAAGQI